MTAYLALGGPMEGEWIEADRMRVEVMTPRPVPAWQEPTMDTAAKVADRGTYTLKRLALFGRMVDLYVWDADTEAETFAAVWRHLMSQSAIQASLGTAIATRRLG